MALDRILLYLDQSSNESSQDDFGADREEAVA